MECEECNDRNDRHVMSFVIVASQKLFTCMNQCSPVTSVCCSRQTCLCPRCDVVQPAYSRSSTSSSAFHTVLMCGKFHHIPEISRDSVDFHFPFWLSHIHLCSQQPCPWNHRNVWPNLFVARAPNSRRSILYYVCSQLHVAVNWDDSCMPA